MSAETAAKLGTRPNRYETLLKQRHVQVQFLLAEQYMQLQGCSCYYIMAEFSALSGTCPLGPRYSGDTSIKGMQTLVTKKQSFVKSLYLLLLFKKRHVYSGDTCLGPEGVP